MSKGDSFCEHFLEEYREARRAFGQERWKELLRNNELFNHFMLYPESPQKESVIRSVARKMKLEFREETFHLDIIFFKPDSPMVAKKYPLPIIAAIEHENDLGSFLDEIVRLAYIRCPLKVGITYLEARSAPSTEDEVASAQKRVSDRVI